MDASEVKSGGHLRRLEELNPAHLSNYSATYDVPESKIEEIFVWMQDKSNQLVVSIEALADRAMQKFGGQADFEDIDSADVEELMEELAARLRDG